MPLNWRLVADELEFILKDSGSVLVYDEFLVAKNFIAGETRQF